jgi:trehalose-6-phosphatase
LLLIAGKIVSVEARHAAAIRSILDSDPKSFAGDDIIDENGLDRAFAPSVVLEAASPFIVNKIIANQLRKL